MFPRTAAPGGVVEVAALPPLAISSVPWDEVAKMDEAVRRFNTEVSASGIDRGANQAFFLPWNMWFANWQVWFTAADADATSRASPGIFFDVPKMLTSVPPDAGGESFYDGYKRLATELNGFLAQWQRIGGQTSVMPVVTASPAEQAVQSAASSASSAAGMLATIGVWALGVTAVAALAFLAGPPLIKAIQARGAAA
jgi:hypothetical protein